MRLLDLFCKAGGAGYGYHLAGFEVVGVDIEDQPRYPFEFMQADALELLADVGFIRSFDAVHASPPCQAHSALWHIHKNDHPDLVAPVREALRRAGRPYVIENVVGAPLENPIMLCGSMFPGRLRTYRHRLFECSVDVPQPPHPLHLHRQQRTGRTPLEGEFMCPTGNFSGIRQAREALGVPWMVTREISQAIPPAYTEFIGGYLRMQLSDAVRMAA